MLKRKLALLCALTVACTPLTAMAAETEFITGSKAVEYLTPTPKEDSLDRYITQISARIDTPAVTSISHSYSFGSNGTNGKNGGWQSYGRIEVGENDISVFDANDFVRVGNELKSIQSNLDSLVSQINNMGNETETKMNDMNTDLNNKITNLTTKTKNYMVANDSHAKADNTGSHTFTFTNSGGTWSSSWQNNLFKNAINVHVYYQTPDNLAINPTYEVNTTTGTLTIKSSTNPGGSVVVKDITVLHIVDEKTLN